MTFGGPGTRTGPRRRPRQTRSVVTVDAILEAAAKLFAREGFERVSTTRIAELAGVSVGSLYEYFPNKDSIAAKLLKCHCDRMLERFNERFLSAAGGDLDEILAAFIEATHDAYAVDVRLHRALLEQMGRVSKPRHLQRVSMAIVDLLENALRPYGESLQRPSIRLAAFMVESAVEALTHRSILYAPELFDGELSRELHVMAVRYLTAPAVQPKGANSQGETST
ncbi:TetR/AcrR family transcriptional regulator [Caballeronia sp. LjRoot34]|uniref:TetR/AcrR family transcriptional regulator n=1 Tax=Caballeronia sp. LjRoot34 TaxID=3342325 RepID=UPI003ECEA46B